MVAVGECGRGILRRADDSGGGHGRVLNDNDCGRACDYGEHTIAGDRAVAAEHAASGDRGRG